MKKITKKKINYLVESLNNQIEGSSVDEQVMIKYYQTVLELLFDIKNSLKKESKVNNLKTDPLKLNKNDILIGEEE